MTACLCLNPQPESKTRNAQCRACKGTIVSCPDTATIYPDCTYVVRGKVYNSRGEELDREAAIAWAKKGMTGIQRRPERRGVQHSEFAWMAM